MGRLLTAGLVLALAACQAPTSGELEASVVAQAVAAPVTAAGDNDPAQAARLYDQAVRQELDGDALAAEQTLLQLAARHPKTRHGRAAFRRLGGGAGLFVVAGVGVVLRVLVHVVLVRLGGGLVVHAIEHTPRGYVLSRVRGGSWTPRPGRRRAAAR